MSAEQPKSDAFDSFDFGFLVACLSMALVAAVAGPFTWHMPLAYAGGTIAYMLFLRRRVQKLLRKAKRHGD